jgi:hypothetical protein
VVAPSFSSLSALTEWPIPVLTQKGGKRAPNASLTPRKVS